jgi:hypothetical protein
VRALEILQASLDCSLEGRVHRRQREAVWRAVAGLVRGGKLWLTALGRALPGDTTDKHRIKAADRLLGNRGLHEKLPLLYQALVAWLLRRTSTPIVVIDWTALGPRHYALCAQMCFDGRTLPIYNRVWDKALQANRAKQHEFLRELAAILPKGCKPVIVTDAGFRSPWFDAVAALGWHFVGRVRNRLQARIDTRWIDVHSTHRIAGNRARNLGWVLVGRIQPRPYRLVLAPRPILKGRTRITRRGTKGRRTQDRRSSTGAREPWLLATSLRCNPAAVVQIYRLRMQIEQSFRDAKNHRYGWSLHHVGCKSAARLDILLLVAALAMNVTNAVGRAAMHAGLSRHFQANTLQTRRVLSCFVLGLLVLNSPSVALAPSAFAKSWREIPRVIALNAAHMSR